MILLVGVVHSAPFDQPTPEAVAEARRIVHEMMDNPRGPYSRIRWFCNDGTTQPPVAYACREHGGGRQHAEYSSQQRRLAELGWFVGTIYAGSSYEELFESVPRQQRLRQLALEQYLIDIDDGWVLREAISYRGRVQIEDEEWTGREILLRLLSDSSWALDNFLLVREAARVIPHGEDTDLGRKVRRLAVELAEMDPAAERWRAEIHAKPNARTAARLRHWLASRSEPVAQLGEELASSLDLLYGPAGRQARVGGLLDRLKADETSANWRKSVISALQQPGADRVAGLCDALGRARSSVLEQTGVPARLALIDTMQSLETEVQLTFQEMIVAAPLSRIETLRLSRSLIDCAFGSGLISATEHGSLARHLDIDGMETVPLVEYRNAVARLKRAPGWAVGTIRYTFAEALIKYTALDPRAARFSDDLLRSSPMWMLGDTLKTLSKDIDFLSGSVVEMNGHPVASAVALNSGLAKGTLRIFTTIEDLEGATFNSTDIVVLPETIAELSPVAGILTLGEGNALSHVQLLARNFGIPNVAIDQDTVDLLQELENSVVILVVDNNGNVVLKKYDEDVAALLEAGSEKSLGEVAKIEVPMPDLSVARVLPLAEIGRHLSGQLIGPKAANLGELNRLFPGRVSPALAIPFGIYAEHLQNAGLMERVKNVFADIAAHRIEKAEFDVELASIRQDVAQLKLSDETRAELIAAMNIEFGEATGYGIFVRSDTNVEDLPQFTGAGLNETIGNVVGLDEQLAAISKVWSSVLSPRSVAWRASVLANPAQIYASVLLMKSVPSTKSGVLVTANLFDRSVPALTASAAWGVGGAVAGEPAESVVLYDNRADRYSEAKSPYQRRLAPTGGIDWVPAKAGPVLEPNELDALRQLAAEVNEKYAPVLDETGVPRPWDIEFGFIDGELTLFQIRPLVERGTRNADSVLRRLQPDMVMHIDASQNINLDQQPGT